MPLSNHRLAALACLAILSSGCGAHESKTKQSAVAPVPTGSRPIALPTSQPSLSVSPTVLPNGLRGSAHLYQATLQASGGSGSGYQWQLVAGALPPGIQGAPSSTNLDFTLSGSATAAGSFAFTLQVSDSVGAALTVNYVIQITDAPSGDFNGDGIGDLAVVAQAGGALVSPASNGVVLVYFGSASSGISGAQSELDADLVVTADPTLQGPSVVDFADLNGDGIADLIVGVTNASVSGMFQAGAVCVFYGSKTVAPGSSRSFAQADWTVTGEAAGDLLGFSISASDLDGDGIDDLILGTPHADVGSLQDAGKIYLLYGSGATGVQSAASASAIFTGTVSPPSNRFQYFVGRAGRELASGDLNGDGHGDLVVRNGWQLVVIFGSPTPFSGSNSLPSASSLVLDGMEFNGLIQSLEVVDLDGDGKDELIAAGEKCRLLYGTTLAGLSAGTHDIAQVADATFDGHQSNASEHCSVSSGDFDGDGTLDLAFASPGETTTHNGGTAFVFYGSAAPFQGSLPLPQADAVIENVTSNRDKGGWCLTSTDADSDGRDELFFTMTLFGGSGFAGGGMGGVYVIPGGPRLSGTLDMSRTSVGVISGFTTRFLGTYAAAN